MKIELNKSGLLRNLLHFFLPDVCVVCERELLEGETGVCLNCLYKLPKTNNFKERDNRAEILMEGRIPFERIAGYCVYSKGGILQPLIHNLKYYHRKEIGLLLGRMFGEDLAGSEFIKPVDLIVPVPLHPKKKKSRGYNQAEIIALGISESTSVPLSTDNLVRVVHNPTQTKQTKTERWENVKGIFDVVDEHIYEQKHILLVDDVITTGSTIEACGVALQKCSNIKISIATIGEVF
ncbi:MAG: ComF family protein [Fermentimonas sp.]|nr:ComF family protein [Fermentimonas sp.]